ncbi:kinase-like protein [Gymnopus androsaceus JB14]|uniref:Kinase-like protein n=1 Tax=Gymnopus androsaceus JB14 TaxID=1447944 RepID=A0A6A4HDM1_9AGAR|nr:kinase-like protein [Gymnopus androsaceus JB14]
MPMDVDAPAPSVPPPPPALFSPLNVPPPPPKSPPPPAPPPDVRLMSGLPPRPSQASVSIPLPSKPILSAPTQAHPPSRQAPPPPRPKPKPSLRSRSLEKRVYGHVFFGCGDMSDYDITRKLGEGTFGEVHKAMQRSTSRVKEGMPVTALREIKILKALMGNQRRARAPPPLPQPQIYMVFPYMDHDLAGLLENERVKLNPSQIKLYMRQLLEGTEYMHRNNILHRDMKAANLLISNDGSLRIADFGLARAFWNGPPRAGMERKYTNCVNFLLGARDYGGEVDIWGVGCVLGEMFTRRPILPGTSDMDQLDKIWSLCGAPNQHTWPHYDELPGLTVEGAAAGSTVPDNAGGAGGGPGGVGVGGAPPPVLNLKRFGYLGGVGSTKGQLRGVFSELGHETLDLMEQLLTCNPQKRITASQALEHDYFWTDPMPADPKTLPTYEASHEFDKRRGPPVPPNPGPPGGPPGPPPNPGPPGPPNPPPEPPSPPPNPGPPLGPPNPPPEPPGPLPNPGPPPGPPNPPPGPPGPPPNPGPPPGPPNPPPGPPGPPDNEIDE